MNRLESLAWELLCEDTKHCLLQYDYWEDVSERTQEEYLRRAELALYGGMLGETDWIR